MDGPLSATILPISARAETRRAATRQPSPFTVKPTSGWRALKVPFHTAHLVAPGRLRALEDEGFARAKDLDPARVFHQLAQGFRVAVERREVGSVDRTPVMELER